MTHPTSVFRLDSSEAATRLHCKREREYTRVAQLRGQPVAVDSWTPLEVQIIRDGSAGEDIADLVMLGLEPAFTAHAVEALQDLLYSTGQILPLRCSEGEFYLWNITTVVDALDEATSTVQRFTSGKIMSIEHWSLLPEATSGLTAFKIPQMLGSPLVTSTFMDRVDEEALKGFAPKALWRSS